MLSVFVGWEETRRVLAQHLQVDQVVSGPVSEVS